MEIYPGINVSLGANLTKDEIGLLPEKFRGKAYKECDEAPKKAEEAKIRAFYAGIADKFGARNYEKLLDAVIETEIEINNNAKEIIRFVLLILLKSPISDEAGAKRIIYGINKIGEKASRSSWKEKIQVRINAAKDIIPIVSTMKDQWDNGKLVHLIHTWESANGFSGETIIARRELEMPVMPQIFLAQADVFLKNEDSFKALSIYNGLRQIGIGVNFDGKNRNEMLSIAKSGAKSGDCDWYDKFKKAAIKEGIIPKPKAWWVLGD